MRKTESKNQGETFIDSFVEDRTLVVLVHWLYTVHIGNVQSFILTLVLSGTSSCLFLI